MEVSEVFLLNGRTLNVSMSKTQSEGSDLISPDTLSSMLIKFRITPIYRYDKRFTRIEKEFRQIRRERIKFSRKGISFTFDLLDLSDPDQFQVRFSSIAFKLKQGNRITIPLDKIFDLSEFSPREINKVAPAHIISANNHISKQEVSLAQPQREAPPSIVEKTCELATTFEHFKTEIEKLPLIKYIQNQQTSIETDLERFSIKFALKILLFLKYLTEIQNKHISQEIEDFFHTHLLPDKEKSEMLSE